MAEFAFTLMPAPVLGGVDMSIGTNRIRERDDLALVSVATPQGGHAALTKALKSAFKLQMPSATESAGGDDMRALCTAPDQMLLIFPHDTPDAEPFVQAKLKGAGYTTDQTDAYVVLEIEGPDALAALERLCPVDIHPMPEGGFARTVMEHMGATVLRLGPTRFQLLAASSSAKSFLHAVEVSFRNVTM